MAEPIDWAEIPDDETATPCEDGLKTPVNGSTRPHPDPARAPTQGGPEELTMEEKIVRARMARKQAREYTKTWYEITCPGCGGTEVASNLHSLGVVVVYWGWGQRGGELYCKDCLLSMGGG